MVFFTRKEPVKENKAPEQLTQLISKTEIEKNARDAGASALVYKPNDVNELCETVQRLIQGGDAS